MIGININKILILKDQNPHKVDRKLHRQYLEMYNVSINLKHHYHQGLGEFKFFTV